MVTRQRILLLAIGVVWSGMLFAPRSYLLRAHGAAEDHAKATQPMAEKKESSGEALEGGELINPVSTKGHNLGFNFPFDLSVWTLVVFFLVFAVLYYNAWGPIAKGLDKRESDIAFQIAEAARRNEEAKQLLVEYEKKISAAQDEVRQMLDEGRRNSERRDQEMLEKAKAESAAEVQRGKQQIQAATTLALNELAKRSSELAVELAGKIIRRQLTSSDHTQLINEAVSNFSSATHASGGVGSTPV